MDYIVYLIFRAFSALFSVIPRSVAKWILHLLVTIVYWIDRKHYHIAMTNLELAFGDTILQQEKERIIKAALRNMAYNIYEFMVLPFENEVQMQEKIHIENEEVLLPLLQGERPIVIVSGHYGCWELAMPYFATFYNPLTIISRKMNNPYINDIFVKTRHQKGMQMCEKRAAAMCMVKALKKGRSVALTIDQSVNSAKSVDVNFFGEKVTQVDSPVRLASKLGATILPLFSISEDLGRYKLIFKEPIEVDREMSEEEVIALSQKLADILETQIKKRPDDWFWQHRRWKSYHREIYDR